MGNSDPVRIGALTIIEPDRPDLIENWVLHYDRWCDRKDMHVLIIGTKDPSPVKKVLSQLRVPHYLHPHPFETRPSHLQAKKLTHQVFKWKGWHFSVDSDEFFDPDVWVENYIRYWDSVGIDHCHAKMIDRVSEDGSLPEWKAGVDPFKLFPREYPLTEETCKSYAIKAPLLKNPHFGLHHAHGLSKKTRAEKLFGLYHFKWDATVIDRMQKRVDNGHRFPFAGNFKMFIDFYKQHGKIPEYNPLP